MRGQSEDTRGHGVDTAARRRATLRAGTSTPTTPHAHTRHGPPYSVPRAGCGAHTQFDTAWFVSHNIISYSCASSPPPAFAGSFLVHRGDNQTNKVRRQIAIKRERRLPRVQAWVHGGRCWRSPCC